MDNRPARSHSLRSCPRWRRSGSAFRPRSSRRRHQPARLQATTAASRSSQASLRRGRDSVGNRYRRAIWLRRRRCDGGRRGSTLHQQPQRGLPTTALLRAGYDRFQSIEGLLKRFDVAFAAWIALRLRSACRGRREQELFLGWLCSTVNLT